MKETKQEGVDISLRKFIKELGYLAGGAAVLATSPWLTACTPEKLKEISGNRAYDQIIIYCTHFLF